MSPREVQYQFQTQDEKGAIQNVSGSGFLVSFAQADFGQELRNTPVLVLETRDGRLVVVPAETCRFVVPTVQLLERQVNPGILRPGGPFITPP